MKKQLLALILCILMVFPFVCTPAYAVTITDDEVFIKQVQGSGTCAMTSCTMMLRRRAILDGNSNWKAITDASLKSNNTIWVPGDGLAHGFSYNGINVGYKVLTDGTSTADKKTYLISMLSTHPEGVVIREQVSPHAVLLTDYDSSTDTFYCADPGNWSFVGKGRMQLVNSSFARQGNKDNKKTQDQMIAVAVQVWYVKNGNPVSASTVSNGTYTLAPACAPSARLDVAGGSKADWTNVQIYANNGSTAQQWKITDYEGNGESYVISSKASGKALYCAGWSSEANVMQYEFYAMESQKWMFKDAGDGYYYIIPCTNSNLRLDVSGGKSANGTNVQVYTANQSAAQKWKLTRIDQPSKPDNVRLSTDKDSYKLGETVTITPSANNATHFAMSIWLGKFSTGTRVHSQNNITGKVTFKPTQTGNYTIRIDAINSAGFVSTEKTFTVTEGGHWGPWKEWTTTAVTATSTRQVETRQVEISPARTEYRYVGYVYYDYRRHECWCETYMKKLFGSATLRYSNWSTTRYSPGPKEWTCGSCRGNHVGVDHYANGKPYWHEYLLPDGDYYWEESRTVSAQYQTQYRYRDWVSG